jgi:hypothetical protein
MSSPVRPGFLALLELTIGVGCPAAGLMPAVGRNGGNVLVMLAGLTLPVVAILRHVIAGKIDRSIANRLVPGFAVLSDNLSDSHLRPRGCPHPRDRRNASRRAGRRVGQRRDAPQKIANDCGPWMRWIAQLTPSGFAAGNRRAGICGDESAGSKRHAPRCGTGL